MEEGCGDQKPLELTIKRIVSAKPLVKSRDNSGDNTLLRLFLASSVSGAIHYGWGLQISILTLYAQLLWSSTHVCFPYLQLWTIGWSFGKSHAQLLQ